MNNIIMNINIEEQEYYQYAIDVLAGKITAGRYIKLACSRFFDLLKNDKYYFDCEAVNRVIDFCSLLKHSTAKHAGKHFIFETWQKFIVANLYGFFRKDNGTRLCRNAFILMARKNGKTALCSALALYHLIADGEAGGQIFFAANSRKQAKENLFEMCDNFAKGLDANKKYLTIYRDTIKMKNNNSFIKCVSADTSRLDGYNLSFAVCDETHEYRNNKMINVIESAMGNRKQPLLIEISTAGFNLNSSCKMKYDLCTQILEGEKKDDSLMCFIFQLDSNDKWDDEKCWIKSNPNLEITAYLDYIYLQINKAKNLVSEETNVKTKNLNMWCSSSAVWIPEKYVQKSTQKLDLEQFIGCDCYVGVDLACTRDLTAVSYMFLKDNKYYFFNKYYLPSSALEGNANSFKYKIWQQKKEIEVNEGNVTDYDYLTDDLLQFSKKFNIIKIFYDRYAAIQWAITCTNCGLPLEIYSQGLLSMTVPAKEMERLMVGTDRIIIDDNAINAYCFRNCKADNDDNENIKIKKENKASTQKIDGVIAMLNALGGYLNGPHYTYSGI